jgi:hypothetical protein
MSSLNCRYPGCGDGRLVGKKHCPKHAGTPLETPEEVRAYRRGVRDERKRAAAAAEADMPRIYDLGFADGLKGVHR